MSKANMDTDTVLDKTSEYNQINQLYDECLNYLKTVKEAYTETFLPNVKEKADIDRRSNDYDEIESPGYETLTEKENLMDERSESFIYEALKSDFKVENEINTSEKELKSRNASLDTLQSDTKSERLGKLSQQLPKIIITQSNTSLDIKNNKQALVKRINMNKTSRNEKNLSFRSTCSRSQPLSPYRPGYGDYPRRLVSKSGFENVALISNVPYEKIRMLNDAFHTLINLRWRWIVSGTVVVHFAIWLIFAVFWYITALAHYDFEPDPPKKTCVTGGKDFVTIFLASVEAQTTIGFGDRTIDEECPESIFLFIMQLILGTGLSGVLTCVVYAKLTRPEKLSRNGVGFSKKAVISMRDGYLCLMMRAWDLNYDHIINSEFTAHFVKTHKTAEGEIIRYYARRLELTQRQFLLWPLTLVHVIDDASPLYHMTPMEFANFNYEITVSLKGASASMGTFTQSQTSYLPKELIWGYRFPSVVRYNHRKQKYVIEDKKLELIEPVDTPMCSASQLYSRAIEGAPAPSPRPCTPGTPGSFSDRISDFHVQRSSSFRRKGEVKS